MKLKKVTAVVSVAAALALAPSVAMAYEASDFNVAVSTTTPAPGSAFTVTVNGPASTAITLNVTGASASDSDITIAGTKSLTKTSDASGKAVFTVTLAKAGEYTIKATDPTGTVITTQTIKVAAASTGSDNKGGLAATGTDAVALAIGAGVLVAGGAIAVVATKRRKNA